MIKMQVLPAAELIWKEKDQVTVIEKTEVRNPIDKKTERMIREIRE